MRYRILVSLIIVDAALQPFIATINGDHQSGMWKLHISEGAGAGAGEDKISGTLHREPGVPRYGCSGKLEFSLIEELFCVVRTLVTFRYSGVLGH